MDHREFATTPARPQEIEGELVGRVALEVGGGLCLALAISLAKPALPLLLAVVALVPQVFACSALAIRQVLAWPGRTGGTSPSPSLYRGPTRRPESARAGFDRSGRLG